MKLINGYNGIVIFGGAGSGKDTVAEIIEKTYDNFTLYNIGYICRELMLVANVNENWTGHKRELSQLCASKLREIDENIFNDYTLAKSKLDRNIPIITGGRTFADIDYWKSKNFLILGVKASIDIRTSRLLSRDGEFNPETLNHGTERYIDYIVNNLMDFVIENNEGLEELESSIINTIDKLIE